MATAGLGNDIWTIPFHNIKKIFKVSGQHPDCKYEVSCRLTISAAPLCRRSVLYARGSLDATVLPLLLPARLPDSKHLRDGLYACRPVNRLRHFEHLCDDLPVYSGLVLLERMDWPICGHLYQDQHLFVVQGSDADRHGPHHHEHSNPAPDGSITYQGEEGPDLPDVLCWFPVRTSALSGIGTVMLTDAFLELSWSAVCACNRSSSSPSLPIPPVSCTNQSQTFTDGDDSDDNAPAVYWSIAECDIAIICACMPFLPSLLKSLFPSVFGELSKARAESATPEASQSTQASQSTSVSHDSVGKEKDVVWQMESSA